MSFFKKTSSFKQFVGVVICSLGMAVSVASAGEELVEEPGLWDKTKAMFSGMWDSTEEGSEKAWDKTKEVSGDAWDATKEAVTPSE
jgi:phage-related minor tail protein